jgi:hypothetical protein
MSDVFPERRKPLIDQTCWCGHSRLSHRGNGPCHGKKVVWRDGSGGGPCDCPKFVFEDEVVVD